LKWIGAFWYPVNSEPILQEANSSDLPYFNFSASPWNFLFHFNVALEKLFIQIVGKSLVEQMDKIKELLFVGLMRKVNPFGFSSRVKVVRKRAGFPMSAHILFM